MSKFCQIIIIFSLILCTNLSYAIEPWYTGPLLAPSGTSLPVQHTNFELYGFSTKNFGVYDENWKSQNMENSYNTQFNPVLSYGLTDKISANFNIPYTINKYRDQSNWHIGDVAVALGFQLLTEDESFTNLRIIIQEIFPTGRFDDLTPTNLGTDGTGDGEYQTGLALVFQNLFLFRNHFYRQRLSFSYVAAMPSHVRGANTYGGNDATNGSIKVGNLFAVNLAGEYSMTQNWVAVMEVYYFYRGHVSFEGFPGFDDNGNKLNLNQTASAAITFAPAIEYNFSENYGLIAGLWFPVRAKNFAHFTTAIVAFNAYW